MYPVYRFMEPHHEPCSLSHQRDHNSHPYHHHPTWDSLPMHYNGMNMMNHPNPPDYNACCNKSYPYGFHGFRPPYPHYQPPPQFYYPGPYPPYPDPYQRPYFVPPNSHCCGCANHACHQKENTGVKIEEQSPEPEHKKSGDSSGFVQLPNYPYPVVWVPPGYLNDKNINSLKNSVHGGEEKKKTQLPWPLVWMPGNDKPEEAVKELKEINATPKSVEEPPKFKIIPLKFLENGNEKENKESRENKIRSIPVKQVEQMPQGLTQVDDDKKSSIVEKPMEKEVKKSSAVEKPMEQEVKKSCSSKQTSPTKSSKLPPVCLRVDPLPSKKRSNGSSRSPSPPGIKETKDNAKKEIKVLEIKDKSPSNVVKQVSGKVASDDTTKVMESLDERKSSEDEIVKNMTEDASDCKKVEDKKIIKSLSESEAALLIQSAYRGYEVRRTQLLEKLRKIAHVRERIDDVRTQIQQLEASKEIDSKQRAILSEIVMNLLLQLDTIQGLHPDVREVRKSVARELVCLQEKLDALGSHNSKSNDLDEVEKESKIKAPEDGIPTITVTKPFDEKDGEKQEKKTEDDEQKSSVEMAEPPEHEQEGQSQTEGHSTDSKMLVESHLISDEKEKESVDDKDDKASDPLVSTLHGEENDDKTIMQSEDSSKMLDIRPESEDERIKLKEDSHEEKNLELSCIEDEIEKNATTTPEIVPSQSESAEISEKLKLKEDRNEESSVMPCIPDVISENAVAVEGAAIEKIVEETITMTPGMVPATSEEKPKLQEDSNEESSVMPCIPDVIAENAVAAEGAEIEKIVEETITMTPEMVPAESESAETSEDKPKLKEDSNEESSVMPCIPDVIAEKVAAEGAEIEKISEETTSETPDIVPAQREYTETCEEKTKLEEDINEDSPMMPCNAGVISDTVAAAAEGDELEMISEETAVMTPDIVPAKSESAEIPHEQSESLEPTSKQGSVDHVQCLVPEEKRLMEENQKLREMVEKLLEAGKEQLGVISSLNGRVKDLERKLSQKKKPRVVKRPKKILTSNTLSTGNILSSAA